MGVDLNKIFLEWSYRSEKGYPDMDNPSDLFILKQILKENNISLPLFEKKEEPVLTSINPEELKSLIDTIKDDPEALKHIKNYIQSRPFQTRFYDHLTKSNITDKTVDTANAPQVIFNILSSNEELQSFNDYLKNPKGFSSLGLEGNLLGLASNFGLSADSLRQIIDFSGTEGGRGVGKGEVALALLFGDVSMSKTKGDLDWGGKYLEVKGTQARLGGWNRAYTNFDSSDLGKLAGEKGIDIAGVARRIDRIVIALIDRGEDEKKVRKALIKFLDTTHPDGDAKQYFQNIDLFDENTIRKSLIKLYINNYSKKEGVDHFIFLNTKGNKFGSYLSFTPDQAPSLIDSGKISFDTFKIDDLDPKRSG